MSNKHDFKLDVISGITEDIVDKNLKKRFELWFTRKNTNRLRIIPILVAATLLIGIIAGTLIALFGGNGEQPPVPTEPPVTSQKQVPVYEGMTVSNEAPTTATVNIGSYASGITPLGAKHNIDQKDPFHKGEDGKHIEDIVKESFSAESAVNEYFAKKNEDIYILIHISNPDEFEILSFTLNGTKYSSYMFEPGSDMETLILKYNVGDVEGIQEYTIDAIKYVDGEDIKDVRMDGDRTVKVNITPEEQPTVTITNEAIGFSDITLTAMVTDANKLIESSQGELYAVIYDGEALIVKQEISAGTATTLSGLKPSTIYQYAIVAVYDAIDGEGKVAHMLTKKAFATESYVELTAEFEGWNLNISSDWDSSFTGEKKFSALAIYQGDTKIMDLSADTTTVSDLPEKINIYLVATVSGGDLAYTVRSNEVTTPSEDLSTDTVLYINRPIEASIFGDGEFAGNTQIETIYLGNGVTSIGSYAFKNCTSLKTVVIGKGTTCLGSEQIFNSATGVYDLILSKVFFGCTSLENITVDKDNPVYHSTNNCIIETQSKRLVEGCKTSIIPTDGSVTNIAHGAFEDRIDLTNITIPNSVLTINDTAFRGTGLTEIVIPNSVTSISPTAFQKCAALESITVENGNTVYHSNGNCLIETATKTLIFGCKSSIIPNDASVTKIGPLAFCNCVGLTSIVIPDAVTHIAHAFWDCKELTEVTISNNITYVNAPFIGCSKLKTIHFQGTKELWEVFDNQFDLGLETGEYTIKCTDGDVTKTVA